MERLVLELSSVEHGDEPPHIYFCVVDPPQVNSADRLLAITATEAEFEALQRASLSGDAVKLAGQKLFEALARHPDVDDQLRAALQARPDEHCPVYLQIKNGARAEDLPWETLCSPRGDFIALDERWGLGRVVKSTEPSTPMYKVTPPLRIAAILSCLGVKADGELAALREAIGAAGDLPIELLLVISEEGLYDRVTAEAPPGLRVEFVPAELRALQEMVQGFQPHVLHFFCHGTTAPDPHLLLAVKSDWIPNAPPKSLALGAKGFRKFTRETGQTPWLLVLNACESAAMAGQENLQSLASRLLYYGAAPAVVGMREPVLSGDANVLTSVFYRRLLADLRCRLDRAADNERDSGRDGGPDGRGNDHDGRDGGGDATGDWVVRLVVEARNQLAAQRNPGKTLDVAAASTKEWTLPVAYISDQPFSLEVGTVASAASARLRLELEALRQLIKSLPPDADAEPLRADAQARIRKLERQLEEPP